MRMKEVQTRLDKFLDNKNMLRYYGLIGLVTFFVVVLSALFDFPDWLMLVLITLCVLFSPFWTIPFLPDNSNIDSHIKKIPQSHLALENDKAREFWESDIEDIEASFLGDKKITSLPPVFCTSVPTQGSVLLGRIVDIDNLLSKSDH
jgi:hypothetical protein